MAKQKRNSRNQSIIALRKESSSQPMPTTLDDIPDKLLELILLNLTSPLWLIHAAATSRRWRRIVSSDRFLRLLHHHPPDAAGYYHPPPLSGGSSTFVPASSSAITVDRRGYFSLDFLPGGGESWKLADSSGSLLLLKKRTGGWMRHCFPDLVVCEPLTRRYRLVPRPAEMKRHGCLGVFLHGNCNGLEHDFWVSCVLYECYTGLAGEDGTIRSCLFGRRRRGIWSWATSPSVVAGRGGLDLRLRSKESLQFVGHDAQASFWRIKDDEAEATKRRLLVCAYWNAWFKLLVLPQHVQRLCADESTFRFVDGGDHKMRVVCLEGRTVRVFAAHYSYDYNGGSDWVLENILDLSIAARGLLRHTEEYVGDDDAPVAAKILNVSRRCVVLVRPGEETWPFSVDVRTMRVERWRKCHDVAYRYELPWPPRLQACLSPCKRRRQGPCYEICTC